MHVSDQTLERMVAIIVLLKAIDMLQNQSPDMSRSEIRGMFTESLHITAIIMGLKVIHQWSS